MATDKVVDVPLAQNQEDEEQQQAVTTTEKDEDETEEVGDESTKLKAGKGTESSEEEYKDKDTEKT